MCWARREAFSECSRFLLQGVGGSRGGVSNTVPRPVSPGEVDMISNGDKHKCSTGCGINLFYNVLMY